MITKVLVHILTHELRELKSAKVKFDKNKNLYFLNLELENEKVFPIHLKFFYCCCELAP